MKIFKSLLILCLCMGLSYACSDLGEDLTGDLKSGQLGSDKDGDVKMVTVPFKADFISIYHYDLWGPEEICGDYPPMMRIYVSGPGTGTHLGELFSYFEFCFNTETSEYGNMYGYFEAANGDKLFVENWGQIVPRDEDDPPYIVDKWLDPFIFVGGTGRFEDATGGGMTNSYNSTEDDVAHHHWEGTITMKKGKR